MGDLFPVPPSVIVQLKRVGRSLAEQLLAPHREKLTDGEYERYLSMAQPDVVAPGAAPPPEVSIRITDPGRRVFMAAAWIAGASFPQIASIFGVRRQTIQDQVSLVFPAHRRAAVIRLTNGVTYETLLLMKEIWDKNRTTLGDEPIGLASRLLDEAFKQMDA